MSIITAKCASNMLYIHQNEDWPNFIWDSEMLSPGLAAVRYAQGQLVGWMRASGFRLRQEASLRALTDDVVKSSAIEGEQLNPQEVRSSIARRLGLDSGGLVPARHPVEGIVEMMLDATQSFTTPLTVARLFDWHAALFPTGRSGMRRITTGAWRTREAGAMQVVSGPMGRERVHFEAPTADRLHKEMGHFLRWFQCSGNDRPCVKGGIAHLWFITIHPFEDGNGRIARAITDMALARADGSKERFYSMSSQIEAERKDYYNILETQQRGKLDITRWLDWFLGCLGRAFERAEETLEAVLYKAHLYSIISQLTINERQKIVIDRMLEDDWEGHLNTSKYARLVKTSKDTALRDIRGLLAGGVLVKNPGGGRSASYRLA